MAQQVVNIGTVANDSTGDPLRTAFGKLNDNDTELYAAVALRLLASAVGTAAAKNVGTAAGQVPLLDGSGLLDTAVLPALAISDVSVVASQAAMLALAAQRGDIAVRTDLNKSYVLSTNSPSTLADWKDLLTPTDAVLSVAGLTGAISSSALKTALTLVKADVGLGSVDNTADAAKSVSSAATLAAARTIDGQSFNGSANVTVIAPGTHAASSKTTPVDADELPLVDSASSNALAKLTWANLKATLKTYFDSLTTTLTNKTINGASNTLTVRLANDVSGTLPVANGGTGDTGTGWTTYSPTLTGENGALGTGNTITGAYKVLGKTIFLRIKIVMGASGAGTSTTISVSLPVNALAEVALAAKRTDLIGGSAENTFLGTANRVTVTTDSGGGNLLANSTTTVVSGSYESV